ncbi:protein of unknown function [Burkholderia multivorans]
MSVAHPGLITMSMRELDRLKVVEAVVEQRLMPWRAAERLGLSASGGAPRRDGNRPSGAVLASPAAR